jgi:hypothetical protein
VLHLTAYNLQCMLDPTIRPLVSRLVGRLGDELVIQFKGTLLLHCLGFQDCFYRRCSFFERQVNGSIIFI